MGIESGQSVFNPKKKTSHLRRALDKITTPLYPSSPRCPASQERSKAEGLKTDLSSEAISPAPDLLSSLGTSLLLSDLTPPKFLSNNLERNKDPTL